MQLTNIVSFPREHFSLAQDTLSGPRFPGGTLGLDHLVDGAAVARNSKIGHGRKHTPVRLRYSHITMTVRPRVSLSPAGARGPFSLLMTHSGHVNRADVTRMRHDWEAQRGRWRSPAITT